MAHQGGVGSVPHADIIASRGAEAIGGMEG